MVRFEESVVDHTTLSELKRDVAPVTERVLQRTVAHPTLSAFERVDTPVTQRVHATVAFPPTVAFQVLRNVHVTSRLYPGLVFQIPIYEPDSNARALVIPEPLVMNLVRYPPLHAEPRTQVA